MSLAETADKTEARGRETPARILAETVKALGIRVSANRNIGGDFEVIPRADFEHKNCERTNQEEKRITVKENLQEECGEGTVYLAYDYETPFSESTDEGQIRLVKQDHRYIKYYDASGTRLALCLVRKDGLRRHWKDGLGLWEPLEPPALRVRLVWTGARCVHEL